MKYVLLPGLDGTGLLFKPFIDILPKNIETVIIRYPTDKILDYNELVNWTRPQLPQSEFTIIAESFSGYVAYLIGQLNIKHLNKIVFVASFLDNPNPKLLLLSRILPIKTLLKINTPKWIIKKFLMDSKINKQTIDLFHQCIKTVNPVVLFHRIKLISELKGNLPRLNIPTFYIKASKDKLVSKKAELMLIKTFPNIDQYNIDGPHFLLQAKPNQCKNIIFKS